jgi:hypothetical protein
MSILVNITIYCGDAIIKYKKSLFELITVILQKCNSRRAIELLSKMIRNIMVGLTHVYPVDFRSEPEENWTPG